MKNIIYGKLATGEDKKETQESEEFKFIEYLRQLNFRRKFT